MKIIDPRHIKYSGIFGLFAMGFLLVFIGFPLTDTLPGSTDGWAYISFFRSFNNTILAWFNDSQVGQSFYPNQAVYMYGDPCVLGSVFYLPFQWLGANIVWAWALMLTLVYAFTAFGAYLFFKYYTGNNTLGFVAAILFSTSGFLWGNVDSPNAFYFGTLFMSLYFSLRFFDSWSWKHLIWAVVMGGATLYFSSYIFVFQILLLIILWLFNAKRVLGIKHIAVKLPVALVLAMAFVLPYAYFIANPDGMLNMWNPVREYAVLRALSLDLTDLIRPAKGNLLYPMRNDYLTHHAFFYPQHAAWTGVLLWILALVGLVVGKKRAWLWVSIFVAGFLIAIGPEMRVGSQFIKTPVSILYDIFGLDMAIRNPVRFWFVSLIGLIGLATLAIQWIYQRSKLGLLLIPLICTVYVLENLPFDLHHYEIGPYKNPDEAYIATLSDEKDAVVLELPSSIYTYDIDFPTTLNEYQREHVYQYWQTIHRQNILNGSNAFIPPPRMKVRDLVNELTKEGNLRTLIKDFQVDLIVFHKDLTLQQDDPTLEYYLKADDTMVKLELETPRTVIFRTIDQ